MKATIFIVLLGLVITVLGLSHCGNGGKNSTSQKGDKSKSQAGAQVKYYGDAVRQIDDDAFHFAVGGQPASYDPQIAYTVIEFNVLVNTCETLMAMGSEGASAPLQPGAAESYEISLDGKIYTFHLRNGAKWSNGDPLTAHDFEYSWTRAQSPATNAIYSFLFKEAKIASAKATDDYTFVVTLSEQNGIFMNVVSFLTFCPVHKPTVEKWGKAWCQPEHFVGNGPFTIVEAKLNDLIRLHRNPNYWNAANIELSEAVGYTAKDNQLHVDRYKQGWLDWLGTSVRIPPVDLDDIRDPSDPAKFTAADVLSYLRMANSYVMFNVTRKGFDDPRVRKAFSLAINRKDIADYILRDGSVPTVNFMPSGMGSYKPTFGDVAPDCMKAKELLTQAGYPGGNGFPVYELLFRTNADTESKIVSAITQQWKECLNIEVRPSGLAMNLWQPRTRTHDFDVSISGWQGDYPHPQTFAALLQCGNEMNNGQYCNLVYDALLTSGVKSSDPAEIQRLYGEIETLIAHDMPVAPLFFNPRIHALRPEWTGIVGNMSLHHPLQYVRRVSRP